jgi:hypothetical protein
MNINLETGIKFDSHDVRNFLLDGGRQAYIVEPQIAAGFKLQSTRENSESVEREIEIALAEQWQVEQRGNAISECDVAVTSMRPLKISTKFHLLSQIDTPDAHLKLVVKLFEDYDAAKHGEDIESWVRNSLPADVSDAQFRVETTTSITKSGNSRDGNIAQREAFISLYTRKEPRVKSEVVVVPDMPFDQWAAEAEVTIRKVGERFLDPNFKPQIAKEIQEVKPYTNEGDRVAGVTGLLDAITAEVIPGDCGKMNREDIKLLSLAAWPEFKVEWRDERIRIGCATVVISIPVLKTRISNLNFYVYFALPQEVGRTVIAIGKTCAIRSALGGAVIGVIVGNPAAALVAFNALFRMCIEREVKRCINPGILVLKEAGEWQ